MFGLNIFKLGIKPVLNIRYKFREKCCLYSTGRQSYFFAIQLTVGDFGIYDRLGDRYNENATQFACQPVELDAIAPRCNVK